MIAGDGPRHPRCGVHRGTVKKRDLALRDNVQAGENRRRLAMKKRYVMLFGSALLAAAWVRPALSAQRNALAEPPGAADRAGRGLEATMIRFYAIPAGEANALFPVFLRNGYGYADARGNVVIGPQVDLAGPFPEGRAPAKLRGQWGYIDTAGQWVIGARFEAGRPFSCRLAEARAQG